MDDDTNTPPPPPGTTAAPLARVSPIFQAQAVPINAALAKELVGWHLVTLPGVKHARILVTSEKGMTELLGFVASQLTGKPMVGQFHGERAPSAPQGQGGA